MKSKINFLALLLLFSPILIPAQTENLQGKWRFLTLKENGEDISLPDSSEIRSLKFNKDGRLFSSIACYNLSGKYALGKPRKIKISSLLITSKRCLDDEAKIEQSFTGVLRKTTNYRIKGSVLTLQDERGMNAVTLAKDYEPEQIIPADWEHFEECGFTFYAPSTLKPLKPERIDSCKAGFEDKNLKISITYGNDGKRFEKMDSMTEFKAETIDIGGKKTQLVTYIYNFKDSKNQPQRNYVSGIYASVTTSENEKEAIASLVMTIEGKGKKDLETAKRIFRTISFQ